MIDALRLLLWVLCPETRLVPFLILGALDDV